jgi:hypothetical protein
MVTQTRSGILVAACTLATALWTVLETAPKIRF